MKRFYELLPKNVVSRVRARARNCSENEDRQCATALPRYVRYAT